MGTIYRYIFDVGNMHFFFKESTNCAVGIFILNVFIFRTSHFDDDVVPHETHLQVSDGGLLLLNSGLRTHQATSKSFIGRS